MRIRSKPWAMEKLNECEFFVSDPKSNIGTWHSVFHKKQELWLELGCGKGGFISKLASSKPNVNFLAIDVKKEMLIVAKEKLEHEYSAKNVSPENIRITLYEIMLIHRILNSDDVVKRIYINFCNPWYKTRHRGRRLTHPNLLKQYLSFLANDGQLFFKTDDDNLFHYYVKYFEETGFQIQYITYDLENSEYQDNIETEHEKQFKEDGKKIKFLIAGK